MAPKRSVDKGKRPMSELEAEPPRRSTRSRGLGIHLEEPHESSRPVVIEEAHVEPERVAREVPEVEQMTDAQDGGTTTPLEAEDIGQDGPGVSTMAEPDDDPGLAPRQMTALMRLVAEAMRDIRQDIRQDVREEMRQLLEAQSQQRTSSDPAPSMVPVGQPPTLAQGQAELGSEPEVEVIEEEEWAKAQGRKRSVEQQGGDRTRYRDQRARHGSQGQAKRRGAQYGRGACFRCGQEGHQRKDCPLKDMVCYGCGQVGHKRDSCPQVHDRGTQQRVQQIRLSRAPMPARGQRGRLPRRRQQYQPRAECGPQAPTLVQHVIAQENQAVDEAAMGNILDSLRW